MRRNRVTAVVLALAMAFTTLFSGGVLFTGDMGEVNAATTENTLDPLGDKTEAQDTDLPRVEDMLFQANAQKSETGLHVTTGGDSWTVAVYMCGTDLEEGGAMGTRDLMEILDSKISDNLNIIVIMGGTSKWNDLSVFDESDMKYLKAMYHENIDSLYERVMTPNEYGTAIFQIQCMNGVNRMVPLYDYEKSFNLSSPATVTNFLEFAQAYAPADNFMMAFWDHGGGPLGGAENAQYFDAQKQDKRTHRSITISQIREAVSAAQNAESNPRDDAEYGYGNKYDIISYDCCLMGNVEVAYEMQDLANYMVASENVEPSTGWNWRWISIFEEKAGKPTINEIGERMVDLFSNGIDKDMDEAALADQIAADLEVSKNNWKHPMFTERTLALLDLNSTKMTGVKTAVDELGKALSDLYDYDKDVYNYIYVARSVSALSSMYDQKTGLVDIYKFAKCISEAAAIELQYANDDELKAILQRLAAAAEKVIDTTGYGEDVTEGGGQIGYLPGDETQKANDIVLYRAVASDYAGGNGMTIFWPGFENIDDDGLDAIVKNDNNKYKACIMYDELRFAKDAAGTGDSDYVKFLKKYVGEIYTGERFSFKGGLNAQEQKESDGHYRVHVTATDGDSVNKLLAVDCNYSISNTIDGVKQEVLLGILPADYDASGSEPDFRIDTAELLTTYFVGEDKDGNKYPDFFTYRRVGDDRIVVPAYMSITPEERAAEEETEKKGETYTGMVLDKEIDLRYFDLGFDKTANNGSGAWIVNGIWEYVQDEEGAVTANSLGLDNVTLGNEFNFYPTAIVRNTEKDGSVSEVYELGAKQKMSVSDTMQVDFRYVYMKDFVKSFPDWEQNCTFTGYDIYMNAKVSNKVTLVEEEESSGGSSTGGGGSSGTSSGQNVTASGGTITDKDGNSLDVSVTSTISVVTKEYTGKMITAKSLGATVDTSKLEAAADLFLTKSSADSSKLFKVTWKASKNKNAGTAKYYASVKFDESKAKKWGMKKKDINKMKKLVKKLNKEFKANKMEVTITPVDIQKNYDSAKGSFSKKGKLDLKWVKVDINGKAKKLSKKNYKVISKDKTTGKVEIQAKGKNFTGTVEFTL